MVVAFKSQAPRHEVDDLASPIFSNRPTEFVAAGAIVCEEQAPANCFYQIVSGCIRIYKVMRDGRRALLSFRFKDDFFGRFLDYPNYLYTAEAVTDVRLCRVSHAELREMLLHRPELGPVLMRWAAQSMIDAHDHIVVLGSKTAGEAIANFLVTVAQKHFNSHGATQEIELPFNRTDIADFLGLTIESVSRALTRLKDEGLITTNGNRRLKLRNVPALMARAGLQNSDDMEQPARSLTGYRDRNSSGTAT